MKLKNIFISLIVIIGGVLFLAAIAIPNFIRHPVTSQQNACINNLRLIEGAKQEWATENHKTTGPVSWNDILPYLTEIDKEGRTKVRTPHCPSGGVYTLGNIGEPPRCSIEGHVLAPGE